MDACARSSVGSGAARRSVSAPLTQEELSRLELGLPRLSEWGPELLIPFKVRKLRRARVLWVNKGWFLERGLDVIDKATHARVIRWLIETFAFVVQAEDYPDSAFIGDARIVHADRYGSSSGLAPHGGSGRSAVYGCFQAKGVGVTPLVGVAATPDHRNGCASIAEGVREAVYAEIATAEFPHGAVPVIALLDTGLTYLAPAGDGTTVKNVRRGLIIRPSLLRPAHAERAAMFKRSVTGAVNVQSSDVERTRAVVRRWADSATCGSEASLVTMIERMADQVAFGHVHRLFNGGYFSSNMSITGELHDFGNAHVLPDWSSARVLPYSDGFGGEMKAAEILVRSLDFFFRKYAGLERYHDTADSVYERFLECYHVAFHRECLRVWNVEDLADLDIARKLVAIMRSYFALQQKVWRRYAHGRVVEAGGSTIPWLHDAMSGFSSADIRDQTSDAARAIRAIVGLLADEFHRTGGNEGRLWISWVTALRLLRWRREIDRGQMLTQIERLTSHRELERPDFTAHVDTFIRKAVTCGRTHWPRLPAAWGVLASVTRDRCTALLCRCGPDSPLVCWIEGVCFNGHVCVFGVWIPIRDLEREIIAGEEEGARYSFFLPEITTVALGGFCFRLAGKKISIPAMYEQVAPPARVPQVFREELKTQHRHV